MSMREFVDGDGRKWIVWEVYPQLAQSSQPMADLPVLVPNTLKSGWLAFECAGLQERRRLVPVPEGWHGLPDVDLDQLCRIAEAAERPKRLVE